jgi:arsenate reductase
MREVGIDLSHTRPQRLTETLASHATWLITMGCGEECPIVPRVQREDWAIADPADAPPAAVRHIRDEIKQRVEAFIVRERLGPSP